MKIKYLPTKDARNIHINIFIQENFPHFLNEKNPDLLLLTGGDGALLHAIQDFNHLNIPFFGHAGGTLNFLMNKVEDLNETFSNLENNSLELHFIETTTLKASVVKNGKKNLIGYAVNEVVVGTGLMGYHHFSINSNDGSFKDFDIKGSGICISSDLGSTGYNFNLGGSVLPLGHNLISINGVICNRYLNDILPLQPITISCLKDNSKASVFLDSIDKQIPIHNGEKLLIEKGENIKISFLDKNEFINKRFEIASRYRKY